MLVYIVPNTRLKMNDCGIVDLKQGFHAKKQHLQLGNPETSGIEGLVPMLRMLMSLLVSIINRTLTHRFGALA